MKIVNTRLTKILIAIFAPDERLPSSATLHDTFTYIYAGTNAYAHAGNVTFAGHQVHNHRHMQKHKQGLTKTPSHLIASPSHGNASHLCDSHSKYIRDDK